MAHERQSPVQELSQQKPSAQKPEAHALALSHFWPLLLLQLPEPSHAWPFEQLPETSVPGFARTHEPSEPATLQDLQGPEQAADSQHTPSTQLPDEHDEANDAVQPSPLARPATEYSQVSLAKPLLPLPPNKTATPRPLSNTMAAPLRPVGVVLSVRT
jgi:hypothetical protein